MNITCIICSDGITPSAEIFGTQCGHLFHYACLMQWIERSKTCPQCRHKATEKTIHRVYFNLANTDHICDDVGTLQSKVDNLQFQLKLKQKDVKIYQDKYEKVKTQNSGLRLEVSELEKKIRVHESVVHALKDQITYFRSKSKENDKLMEEVVLLKNKLRSAESVQLAINGTRQEVNDMLRNENNIESLVILAATLKKALLDAENKKRNVEHKYQQIQRDVTKYRRDIASLEISNKELTNALQKSKQNWGEEKKYLTNIVRDIQEGKSDKNCSSIKRIMTESPLPLPQKRLRNDGEIVDLSFSDSPGVESKVKKILESDSPYLPVKTNSFGVNIPSTTSNQSSSGGKNLSIFRGSFKKIEDATSSRKNSEITYDGLGGQRKDDFFPSPKQLTTALKRHKIKAGISSSLKIKKVAPISSVNKIK